MVYFHQPVYICDYVVQMAHSVYCWQLVVIVRMLNELKVILFLQIYYEIYGSYWYRIAYSISYWILSAVEVTTFSNAKGTLSQRVSVQFHGLNDLWYNENGCRCHCKKRKLQFSKQMLASCFFVCCSILWTKTRSFLNNLIIKKDTTILFIIVLIGHSSCICL